VYVLLRVVQPEGTVFADSLTELCAAAPFLVKINVHVKAATTTTMIVLVTTAIGYNYVHSYSSVDDILHPASWQH
jgi:hypothetical protein